MMNKEEKMNTGCYNPFQMETFKENDEVEHPFYGQGIVLNPITQLFYAVSFKETGFQVVLCHHLTKIGDNHDKY